MPVLCVTPTGTAPCHPWFPALSTVDEPTLLKSLARLVSARLQPDRPDLRFDASLCSRIHSPRIAAVIMRNCKHERGSPHSSVICVGFSGPRHRDRSSRSFMPEVHEASCLQPIGNQTTVTTSENRGSCYGAAGKFRLAVGHPDRTAPIWPRDPSLSARNAATSGKMGMV